jgi:hypothetical protein
VLSEVKDLAPASSFHPGKILRFAQDDKGGNMFIGRMLSIGAAAMLGVSSVATPSHAPQLSIRSAGASGDLVAEERAYVAAVGTIADSAARRLDFFPTRAQLRVQAAFLLPSDDAVPFDDLAARGDAASVAIDAALERFADVHVPEDLKSLNAELVKALNDATQASVNLTAAAHACQVSMTSVNRCQVPFSSASSKLAASYKHYLGARAKIGAQVLDTGTHLSEFRRP